MLKAEKGSHLNKLHYLSLNFKLYHPEPAHLQKTILNSELHNSELYSSEHIPKH